MKSLTAVCQTGASMPAINPNGRINRPPHHRGDGENAEMKMYLSKLKDLVPFMPKNRKLSKLEIIQHVIDYICDLQSELETHPEMSNFDAAAALNFTANLERVTAAVNNGHDDEGDDEEDDEMYEGIQERLNGSMQLQQQSSPAQRQPLVDRQTPNTILPATQQQQQQQMIVSAVNNTTATSNSITTNSLAAVTSSPSSTAAATTTSAATNLSSHTLINEKDLDSSRQPC
ncbi:protein extra-macrochaetae [Calliphora vicina]|uniref:protein extra-macrochaetae n=1 Tax=Calliphora vicina TaxID=7373 RepID=UPI00325AA921